MNKVLIGFNIILAAAVVYLFVKSPGGKSEGDEKKTEVKMNAAFTGQKAKGELRIAYVNIDTLNVKYELFKDEGKKLEAIGLQMQQEMQKAEESAVRRSQALQKDFNILTPREQQNVAYQIQKIESDFMALKNKKMARMDSLQNAVTAKGNEAMKKFLDSFAAEKKIDYILRDGFASPMLYGDKIYNITDVVAKALNDEYLKTKGN